MQQPLIQKDRKKKTPSSRHGLKFNDSEKDQTINRTPSDLDNRQEDAETREMFFNSDTFKCILKERETLNVFRQVRKDIESELVQRTNKCKELKEKLENLADLEKRLLMAIEGVQVQNEMDLENLQ